MAPTLDDAPQPPIGDGRRIARNAGSAYAVRLLLGLSVLLVTPYLFRSLGPGGFGTWSVIFTVAAVFDLLELGFSAGVSKLMAELRAEDRRAEQEAALGASIVLMSGLALVGAAVSLAVGFAATGLAADGDERAFRLGMVALAAVVLVRFPCVAYAATLQGHQRYDLWNLAKAVATVGFAVGAVVAVGAGGGVLGVALAYAGSLLVEGGLYVVLLARSTPGISLRPHAGDRGTRRRIAAFGSFALLADSMRFIGQRMDTVVVAALRGATAAGPFAAALKLQSGLQALTLPFVNLLIPMVSELQARGRSDEVVRRLTASTRVALQITLPVAVALSLFADDVVGVWLGSSAPAVTAQIVIVLMVVQTVTLSAFPAEQVLIGIGRVRTVGLLALVEGLSNLVVSIALVAAYGAIGAAVGTLLTSAVLAPVKFPLVCRALGHPTGAYLRASLWPALIGALPAVAAMIAVSLVMDPGLARLALGMGVGLSVAAATTVVQLGPGRILALARGIRRRGGQPSVVGA